MFKNMKIEITDEPNLKSVCDVLESMGYTRSVHSGTYKFDGYYMVATYDDGTYMEYVHRGAQSHKSINLSDLLKMRDDMVKEKARLNIQQN